MNPLNCKIKGQSIVISVGFDVLKFATENHPELYDGEKDRGRYRVKKISVFAKEIVSQLHQEEEDGSTMFSRMFDEAILNAISNGAEGVEEVEG